MTELNQGSIQNLVGQLKLPSYNRFKNTQGIVHIGVGGFHRSHEAYYIHELLKRGQSTEWAICGMGIRKNDQAIYDALKSQDGLYSLITRYPNGAIDSEIIGSITDFIWAFQDSEKAIEKLASPETKIVSLTITEGGYNFSADTGEFDFNNPDVQHDLKNPSRPITVFGYLTEALRRRREAGSKSFTILSCDNIQHNGDVARRMILAFAKLLDKELGSWIEENTAFPSSMVDRITPVTTDDDIDYLKQTYAYSDKWPVTCEPFIQWVVEDDFSNGRPKLEDVGVQFVSDVKPYEKMKLRLLNAGHSVLGIPGALHGYSTINECMADPVFSKFMRAFMDEEATPTLDPLSGIDLNNYKDTIASRFANPNIKDSVSRICSESSAKLPKFLFETIAENSSKQGAFNKSVLICAAWYIYHKQGVDENGKPIDIIDDSAVLLKQQSTTPAEFIRTESIFGDLHNHQGFAKAFFEAVSELESGKKIRELMESRLHN